MNAFHRQCGITDRHIPRRRDDEHDYISMEKLVTAEARHRIQ
jgi:hypothetical protein